MVKRLAVVTGSNKGIGFGIVEVLCKKFDGTVMLCSRDLKRGQEAVDSLKSKGCNPVFHQLDITDESSIGKLKETIEKEYQGLDVLVNNAAIAFKNASTVPFVTQAEETMAVNFFATLSVCKALFPLLRPHARVVNVSSSAGMLRNVRSTELKTRIADPNLTVDGLITLANEYLNDVRANAHNDKGWPNSAYSTSKVMLSALTFIQAREFGKDTREDIVINAVHPGYVDTDMTSHNGTLTIEQGCQAPAYCALLPANVNEPKGAMIWFDSSIVDWQSTN
ncbi:carbonyl reductase [NADPH] 3-like [Panonychus citri]|uniref:carbonyl reductase [NADPH] 3-like n=1 Tax=Panonychus citri TaxID=50023 RepID=UPI0023082A3C|nr:carbonyl reductase [NADPH] 3-like [Panonychus citri]